MRNIVICERTKKRNRGFILLFFSLVIPSSLSAQLNTYKVTRVIDGDTIEVLFQDKEEPVRLIGIDTPELHHPEKPVMYYAKEAYKFTKQMVGNKNVRLEFDESNAYLNHRDKYGRLLAYIYLEDGTFLNAEIIKQGYGFAYTRFPFKYLDDFRKYQQEAIENEAGLWAETIGSPEISNLIMQYENLNDKGKKYLKRYLDSLTRRFGKEGN